MKNLGSIIFTIGTFIAGLLGYHETTNFGAANPGASALYEQSLAQPLGTADANMYVTSGADVQGNLLPVGSYQCLSEDTGQPNFEAICGNVTASATSGLTLSITIRGLSTATATSSNPSFIFTHRRGADVRITDFPTLTILNNQLSGTQTIPGAMIYNFHPCSVSSASTTVCDKNYIDNQVVSGGTPGSTSVAGIFLQATGLQSASSTATGIYNLITYNNLLGSNLSTSTRGNSTGKGNIVATKDDGRIDPSFLDGTGDGNRYTFNATTTMSSAVIATTTINHANIITETAGTISATTITGNGSGITNITIPRFVYSTTTSISITTTTATSSPFVVPAGVITASSTIDVYASISDQAGGGGTNICTYALMDPTGAFSLISGNISADTSKLTNSNFHALILPTGINTQVDYMYGNYANAVTGGTVTTAGAINSGGTSSLNMTNSFSIVVRLTGGGATCTLSNLAMVVNP